MEVFARLFQKAAPIQRAERWSPPQRRNSLILPKRHRRVNAEPRLGRGEPHKWGVPLSHCANGRGTSPLRSEFPLCNKAKLNFMPAFFFDTRGPKKKAWQKRNAAKGVSPSAEGDRRSRRLRRAFEKARAKLSTRHRRDAPLNCNLTFRLNGYIKN